MPPTVPTRPAGGGNIASAWGQWAHDWLKKRDGVRGTTGAMTLSTTMTDIAGCTMTLGSGWFVIFAAADVAVSGGGVGECQVVLDIDGTQQPGLMRWQPATSGTGEGMVSFMWVVNIAGAGVIKLRAKKSIAAGVASVIRDDTVLVVL